MRLIRACFCFGEGALSGADIARIISESVDFDTPHIMTDAFLKLGGKFDPNRHIPRISNSKEIRSVRLGSPTFEGNYFDFGGPLAWGFQTVTWCCPIGCLPDRAFFDEMSQQPGFSAGYISDAEDVQWQSETLISNYELFGKSHDGLPKLYDHDFEEEQIDTLRNPGACHPIPGMWLQAAWRMWFGEGAFKFIPMQRLQGLKDADRIEQLSDKAIFIQLYSEPGTFDAESSRARQISFNNWVGKASLVARGREIDTELKDPSHEIEHGSFDHGGVKRLTVWLDANEKPVVKSRAVSCMISELDENSNIVWTEKKVGGLE